MRIYKRKSNWGVDYRNPITGKRVREIVGVNKKMAEDRLAKVRAEKVLYDTYGKKEYFENINKKDKELKFSDMAKIYLDYAKNNKKSFDSDVLSLSHWSNFLVLPKRNRKLADLFLSEITVKMIEDYKVKRRQIKISNKNSIKEKYIAPATVNRELACLKHFFNKAIEWGYTNENPVRKVKLFKENNSRVRYLEEEEIIEVLKTCDTLDKRGLHLKPIVIIALNTGLRKSEILNLKWKNLDFQNNLVYIETSKNGESAYIPMNNNVRETLKNLSPMSELQDGKTVISEYIFKGRDGKPFTDIRTSFANVLKKTGIKDFKFHDLRHTFASHLVMSGVDLTTVRELMRHKTMTMTLRYSHLSPEHKKEAVERLYRKKDGTNMAHKAINQEL